MAHTPLPPQISAGARHNGALTVSGHLFIWGSNSFGQLGLGDQMRRPTPRLVHLMLSHCIVSVCCGEHHTAVLTAKGAVFTWGDGNYGQLGHGNTSQQIVPRQVQELMGDKVCGLFVGTIYISDLSIYLSNNRMLNLDSQYLSISNM